MYTVIDLLRDQGIEKGIEQGIEKGRQEGRQEGLQKGLQEGLQKGLQKGRQEDIEKLLLKGALSPEEIASILEVDLVWVQKIARKVAGKE